MYLLETEQRRIFFVYACELQDYPSAREIYSFRFRIWRTGLGSPLAVLLIDLHTLLVHLLQLLADILRGESGRRAQRRHLVTVKLLRRRPESVSREDRGWRTRRCIRILQRECR